jgi:hypothetical protein
MHETPNGLAGLNIGKPPGYGQAQREPTVNEYLQGQIDRALDSVQRLREKQKTLADNGHGAMGLSNYRAKFALDECCF